MREARMLASQGVKELLLISQDTTFYGVDRGGARRSGRLLRDLNTVGGIEWIRLLYLYPTTIDDATLAAMAECEKVCKYIDLPLQHASNPVLKRMKRPGTRQHYDRFARPDPDTGSRRRPPHDRSSSDFRARLNVTSKSSAGSSRTSRSTTWASSPTRTRKAPRPTNSEGRGFGGGQGAAAAVG